MSVKYCSKVCTCLISGTLERPSRRIDRPLPLFGPAGGEPAADQALPTRRSSAGSCRSGSAAHCSGPDHPPDQVIITLIVIRLSITPLLQSSQRLRVKTPQHA